MNDALNITLRIIATGIAGYLLGSANTSIIVGRFFGVDIRKHGSGNAGATNALRVLGKKAAILVALGDVLKSIISCIIGILLVGEIEGYGNVGTMVGGLCAVLGHNWPVYFRFKGGKGIFTSFAAVMMMDWRIGLILLGVFIILVAATRYVSLGSIVAAALFPVVSLIPVFDKTFLFTIFALVIAILAVYRHKSNLVRLINGTENKI